MKFGTVSQCTRRLNFGARANWPSVMPSVAWNEILIAGFDRVESSPCLFIDENEYSLEQTLSSLWPKPCFVELSKLWAELEKLCVAFDWPEFCSYLGYHAGADWPPLFDIINAAPDELQKWWLEREVSARDLAPLKSLPKHFAKVFFELATKAVSFAPSKSDGTQILEWLVDIMLAERTAETFEELNIELLASSRLSELHERVRKARFQQAVEREQNGKARVNQLPWPAKTKAAWVRHGDRAGIEIKLFTHSADDLKKQIESLQNVAAQWRED